MYETTDKCFNCLINNVDVMKKKKGYKADNAPVWNQTMFDIIGTKIFLK